MILEIEHEVCTYVTQLCITQNHDSTFCIVARLWAGQSRNYGSIPRKDKGFSLLQSIQAGTRAYPPPYSMSIWYDIFVNCNWFDTQWQQYCTHLHTNNRQNDTTQHNTWNNTKSLEECRLCHVFTGYTLALALQLREKAWKNLSQGSRRVPAGTIKIHSHTMIIKIHTWSLSHQS